MESPRGLAMNRSAASSPRDDDVVFLLDPDMVLLRPIVHDYAGEGTSTGGSGGGPVLWAEQQGAAGGDERVSSDVPPANRRAVRHGNPIAQQDPFLGNEWM
jgi:hypothetical protein